MGLADMVAKIESQGSLDRRLMRHGPDARRRVRRWRVACRILDARDAWVIHLYRTRRNLGAVESNKENH